MIFKKNPFLLPIFLIVLVDILAFSIIIPLLPFYTEQLGGTPQTVGFLVASFAFFQFIAGPILGELSDRIGRKPVLIFSQIGTFIGLLILARAGSLWMVFLARIIDGITAGNLTVAQAYISDKTPPAERAKSFAIVGIAFGIGFLIGPLLSGLLSGYGIQVPIYVAAGISFCTVTLTAIILPREQGHKKERSHWSQTVLKSFRISNYTPFFAKPELRKSLIQFFLFNMAFVMMMSGFALFSERRFSFGGHPFSAKEVGYYYAYLGLIGIVVQGRMVGILAKKWGERRMAAIGFLCMFAGYVGLAFVQDYWFLMFTGLVTSFGTGIVRPALTSLISQSADRTEQGAVLGVAQSLGSIAQILTPILSGFLIDRSQLVLWAVLTGIFSLFALMIDHRGLAKIIPVLES